MRFNLTTLAVLAASLQLTVAEASTNLLVRIHFVGTDNLAQNPNASRLHEIAALPATTNFLNAAFAKLATLPFALGQNKIVGTNNHAADFRPLLDDLIRRESFVEMRGENFSNATTALAVKLDGVSAKIWRANLDRAFADWKVATQINYTNGWLDVQSAHAAAPATTVTDTNWLSVWIDGAKFRDGWPTAQFAWNGDGEFLRTRGTLDFPSSLNFQPQPWLVPTNLIREPLVSLTAMQDPLARWLQSTAAFKAVSDTPISSQIFEWAVDQMAFQTFIAASVDNATNTVKQLAPRLVELGKSNIPPAIGIIHAATNNLSAYWQGLPIISPFLIGAKDIGHEYLLAGMFANSVKTNPLPHELLDRIIGHTNVVAYDWELTQPRLNHWQAMNNIFRMITGRSSTTTNASSQQFLHVVAPKLGNTVTEITATSTNQLTFTRKSHLGLTAFELIALTEWLDAKKFPHTDLVWPPEFKKPELPPGVKLLRKTSTPAPSTAPVPPTTSFKKTP